MKLAFPACMAALTMATASASGTYRLWMDFENGFGDNAEFDKIIEVAQDLFNSGNFLPGQDDRRNLRGLGSCSSNSGYLLCVGGGASPGFCAFVHQCDLRRRERELATMAMTLYDGTDGTTLTHAEQVVAASEELLAPLADARLNPLDPGNTLCWKKLDGPSEDLNDALEDELNGDVFEDILDEENTFEIQEWDPLCAKKYA